MGTVLGVIILVGGFVALFSLFRLAHHAREAISASHVSLGIMQNPALDDDEKEAAMRKQAKLLFGCFLKLTLGAAAALGIPAAIVLGLDALGLISYQRTIEVTLSWEFLTATTAALVLVAIVFGRRKKQGFESPYSFAERTLHQVAFNTTLAQLSVADLEDSFFKKRMSRAENDQPVFITGLPRGGTTLALDMMHRLDEFASHRYRDMPFLLTPLFWNRFSRRFQQADQLRERAHGDGMQVSVDSPEALEEVVWKAFWGKQYLTDRILTWPTRPNESFNEFFTNHMAKIIAIKAADGSPCRYVSKNNLNISRIDYLLENYPGAMVIVPFRDPVRQAHSLLKQHRNFLKIHEQDAFARTYMEAVGHYDFGMNIRPVDFDGWLDGRAFTEYQDINFWLEYWLHAYEHLLAKAGGAVHLHSHERLCEETVPTLNALADVLDIRDRQAFLQNESVVWKTPPPELPTDTMDPKLLEKCRELWQRLRKVSIGA